MAPCKAWLFMEKYVKAVEPVVVADVVKYNDEIIEKTKEVVGYDPQPSLSIEKGSYAFKSRNNN